MYNFLIPTCIIILTAHVFCLLHSSLQFKTHGNLDPSTGFTLPNVSVTPNISLLHNINQWKAAKGIIDDVDGQDAETSEASSEEEGDPQKTIDRAALEDLFSTTSGEATWENVDGWPSYGETANEDLGEWWGVTLSRKDNKMIRLKLVDNGLEVGYCI